MRYVLGMPVLPLCPPAVCSKESWLHPLHPAFLSTGSQVWHSLWQRCQAHARFGGFGVFVAVGLCLRASQHPVNLFCSARGLVHLHQVKRQAKAVQVKEIFGAKHVIRVCSTEYKDNTMAAARKLIAEADRIKAHVDLRNTSIAIDDCYQVCRTFGRLCDGTRVHSCSPNHTRIGNVRLLCRIPICLVQ
jgi:hypothetical protein